MHAAFLHILPSQGKLPAASRTGRRRNACSLARDSCHGPHDYVRHCCAPDGSRGVPGVPTWAHGLIGSSNSVQRFYSRPSTFLETQGTSIIQPQRVSYDRPERAPTYIHGVY
ncbi:hypothetical protein VTO73DRAFT_12388 [Trametes versicolor]